MSRLESIRDLDASQKESNPIVEIDFSEVLALPLDVIQKLVELVASLEASPRIDATGDRGSNGTVRYRRRRSPAELAEVLADRQRIWDANARLKALDDPSSVEPYMRWQVGEARHRLARGGRMTRRPDAAQMRIDIHHWLDGLAATTPHANLTRTRTGAGDGRLPHGLAATLDQLDDGMPGARTPQGITEAGGGRILASAAHTTSVIARSGFFESQSGFVHTRIVSWLIGSATVATDFTRTSRTGAVHTRHGASPLFVAFSVIDHPS